MAHSGIVWLRELSTGDRITLITEHGSFDFIAYALDNFDAGLGYGEMTFTYTGPSRQFGEWSRDLLVNTTLNVGDARFFLHHPRLAKLLRRQRKIAVGKMLQTEFGDLGVVAAVIVTKSDGVQFALASAKVWDIRRDGEKDHVRLDLSRELWDEYGEDHFIITTRCALTIGQQVMVTLPNKSGDNVTLA